MSALTIINARIMDPQSGMDQIGAITIDNGLISGIGDVDVIGETVDAKGLVAAPGLIDMRVSTGEPGTEHRETIVSAARFSG